MNKIIRDFLSEIGRKGGSQPKSDKGTESRREICRKAGLARQAKLREIRKQAADTFTDRIQKNYMLNKRREEQAK